ncbi:MAG: imidazoleglycerol-phosphate dehydratase HisB [Acidaminococcaceae bacterium]|nr:imidazoleglycerol-phosphate dehydratase HisB [Acidaminococcaceae bacterium]MBQ6913160.1 imidazoleglycerol-phosphate dehydratase HisB [Acidaminococcaceae bacterium]
MKKARCAEIKRKTAETQISLKLNLDGEGKCDIATGIGFLDHMLTLLAKHSFMDLTVKAKGDLEVDSHHTVEDIGIVLGEALREALGDKAGIHRYGNCFIPMDETLAQACLDFSGRPFLIFGAEIPKIKLGNYDTEMTEEFFRAIAMHCGLTLHIRVLYGSNVHHIIEAVFKAFARAVAEAAAVDPKVKGVMSSKGVL